MRILLTALLFGIYVVSAHAQCPNPIPDKMGKLQLKACLKSFQERIKSNEDIANLVSDLKSKIESLQQDNTSLTEAITKISTLKQTLNPQLPIGAVVAFDSSESETCPGAEWKLYKPAKGRFIVGAGHGDPNIRIPRKLGDIGGEEEHKLTIGEMPIHSHGDFWGSDGTKYGMLMENRFHNAGFKKLKAEGGNKAHNNMPPFIALYFCKKVK